MAATSCEPDSPDAANRDDIAELIRSLDWSQTPIGPMESWSPALRMMVRLLLVNRFPLLLWWGPEYISIYNEAYTPILGTKHPWALGKPVRECWSEIWHILQPLIDTPFHGGPSTWNDDIELEINRHGFLEETHFTIAYSPVPDEEIASGIGGVLATVHEITDKVVGERRVVALRDLGARVGEAKTAEEACAIAAETLALHAKDIPFALLYLIDADGEQLRLAGAAGCTGNADIAPQSIDLRSPSSGSGWPFAETMRTQSACVVTQLQERFGDVPRGTWSDPPTTAVVLPIPSTLANVPAGVMVAGVSARLRLDTFYNDFLELARAQVATAVANARAYEEERKRAEALAAIDRAKTAFFSNVSHEFRTPLTLMMGPVADGLADTEFPLAAVQRERQEVVRRNGLRLQKLVNALLDFARIEAGRAQAVFVPVDLASLTAELASSFESAIENAGVKLIVDCPRLPTAVNVDPSMWEGIVLNLLSNAFKFTLQGEIRVALHSREAEVELTVTDTGIGIPSEEQAHVFDRFHRVEGAHGRSHEGTGIGLSLVRELVGLHGGTVEVESTVDRGSTFRVIVPKRDSDTGGSVAGGAAAAPLRSGVEMFLAEIAQWSDVDNARVISTPVRPTAERVLVADDNADMRAYITRLLSPHWHVEMASDGEQALLAAQNNPPDLVLADVMMPRMDGLSLVKALRTDERTRTVPIILLSARAGEESTVEGLASGADDYLVKPFSAQELRARVGAQLSAARLRQEVILKERAATQSREDTLAVVSHDLRTPLTAIRTAASLIKRSRLEGEHSDRVRERATIIERSVDGMTRLLADLLDISSLESGTLIIDARPYQVAEVVAQLGELFGAAAQEKGITFVVDIDDPALTIAVDKHRIVQALSNLVGNALKFTPSGGHITVAAARQLEGVLFSVSDTGAGIAPETMAHIFDRYWHSAQEGRQGHGLGLSIAKGIVEAHGGSLAVATHLGIGSTFSFLLPWPPADL